MTISDEVLPTSPTGSEKTVQRYAETLDWRHSPGRTTISSQTRWRRFPSMLRCTIYSPHTGLGRMNILRRAPNANFTALMIAGVGIVALINGAFARRAETHNPPKGKFVEVDGLRLHYMEKGTGSPVVLLHGNQAMADDFEISGAFDLIAEKHRVIALDRPGFGYSDRPRETVWTPSAQADLIRKAFIKLGVEKPVLVGHSWGTLVALAYAIEHPAETGGLLLLSGYYFPSKRLDAVFASLPAIPIIGDLLRYTFWPLFGWLAGPLLLKTVFAPSNVPERFKREFPISMALRPSQIRATAGDSSLISTRCRPPDGALQRAHNARRHYGWPWRQNRRYQVTTNAAA